MYLFRGKSSDRSVEVGPQNSALQALAFKSVSLKVGESHEEKASNEPVDIALIVLSGTVEVELDGVWTFCRESVFASLPVGLLHRTKSPIRVNAISENAQFAIARTPSPNISVVPEPQVLSRQAITTEIRGTSGYSRTVNTVNSVIPDFGLILGETHAGAGNWSSYPPHKHDESIAGIESKHEECYLHHFYPKNGWGFQGIYSPERDIEKAYFIRNGDILAIPYGYHPVVPEPTARHHYLWVLSGSEGKLKMNTHEHYRRARL